MDRDPIEPSCSAMKPAVFCPLIGCKSWYARWNGLTKHVKNTHNKNLAVTDPSFVDLGTKNTEARRVNTYWYTETDTGACVKHTQLTLSELREFEASLDKRKVTEPSVFHPVEGHGLIGITSCRTVPSRRPAQSSSLHRLAATVFK